MGVLNTQNTKIYWHSDPELAKYYNQQHRICNQDNQCQHTVISGRAGFCGGAAPHRIIKDTGTMILSSRSSTINNVESATRALSVNTQLSSGRACFCGGAAPHRIIKSTDTLILSSRSIT